MAVAETVAALRGHSSKNFPDERIALLPEFRRQPNLGLCTAATRAVEAIITDSALRDFWADTPDLKKWLTEQKKLLKRLALPPKPLKTRPQKKRQANSKKPPAFLRVGEKFGSDIAWRHYDFRSKGVPNFKKACALDLWLNLDFTDAELKASARKLPLSIQLQL